MWLLIDNYDSFSQMLLDYLRQLHDTVICIQNDEKSIDEIIALQPQRIILSPGPKDPDHAGITMEVIAHFHDKIPLLGVCLGHQALAQFLGSTIERAAYPIHGKTSIIRHEQKGIFKNMPAEMEVMRYHSLVVEIESGSSIEPWAFATDDNSLMAFGHKTFPIVGIQFHPESVLTPLGLALLLEWNLYFENEGVVSKFSF